ncbi:MAG: NAD-dependent epimerase, partial [Nitrosomonadales bacterium]|nr:NAD-dependent epimerase [Nitrosomonadales bacterium]
MNILVTGVAGFIGMHVALQLLKRGDNVIGIDNLSDYYDPKLKKSRLSQLSGFEKFKFIHLDISHSADMETFFSANQFDRVVHLAAQAGVRYSIQNPQVYVQANLIGFGNILEGCRLQKVEHLVYASSSSVYGANTRIPLSAEDNVDHPVSLYAATKKANELMAHSYSHLYGLPTTGLRFFTVYGPWGRPDMSPWLFTSAILEGRPIDVFNHGKMKRDFTFIDDIVEGTIKAMDKPPQANPTYDHRSDDPSKSSAPYRIYNIGNQTPVELLSFIKIIENALGMVAIKNFLPMQAGDVIETCADIEALKNDVGFEPRTPLAEGIAAWVDWYKAYSA